MNVNFASWERGRTMPSSIFWRDIDESSLWDLLEFCDEEGWPVWHVRNETFVFAVRGWPKNSKSERIHK